MGSIKQVFLGIVAVVGVLGAVLYTSCRRDECKAQACFARGSNCSKGICQCPTGVYGLHCETEYRSWYTGEYIGKEPTDTFTKYIDKLFFIAPDDTTNYNAMELLWIDTLSIQRIPGKLNIGLTNNTAGGSEFVIRDTGFFGVRYSGYGTINGTIATMKLNVFDSGTLTNNTYIFENYIKQK